MWYSLVIRVIQVFNMKYRLVIKCISCVFFVGSYHKKFSERFYPYFLGSGTTLHKSLINCELCVVCCDILYRKSFRKGNTFLFLCRDFTCPKFIFVGNNVWYPGKGRGSQKRYVWGNLRSEYTSDLKTGESNSKYKGVSFQNRHV